MVLKADTNNRYEAGKTFRRPRKLNSQSRRFSAGQARKNSIEDPNAQSSFVRDHQKKVLAVMTGAMALPMVAGVAQAQENNEIAGDPTGDVTTTDRDAIDLNATEVAPDPAFEPAKLKEYPLFQKFWNSTDMSDGTAHEGLDEVTPEGVETLLHFAKTHTLDGAEAPAAQQEISQAERDIITAILEHDQYGTFVELDALPELLNGFGIDAETVHSVVETSHASKVALAGALGMNVHNMRLAFPDAGPRAETTYFSMDGGMAKPMSFVDEYREAKGMSTGAADYEAAPVLGWMMGEEAGHKKHGSFSEKKPFSSSGLNWGKLLFPGDAQIKELPAEKGFDFPIDVLKGFNRSVGGFANQGDHIVVVNADGAELNVEKIIHKDEDGKAESWSAKFTNAAGEEVKPSDVTGLIKDRYGNTKGDGLTKGSLSMGWWGFCDRNTAQRLYKSKFNIPNIDRDVTVVMNGKTITIPKADAQKLLDVDVSDIAGRASFVGNRFNDEPSTIRLTNGSSITGKVQGFKLEMGPNATRGYGDQVTIRNSTENPLLGSIELKTQYGSDTYSLDDIESITRNPETNEVELHRHNSSYVTKGELVTDISFEGAETVDGKQVLNNTKDNPILGGVISIDVGAGKTKTIPAADVKTIAGELQVEMSISEYIKFIEKNDGMYATDNSKATIVSNGMRWINKIDSEVFTGDETPEFAKDGLTGIKGEMVRQPGDSLIFVDGKYKSGYSDNLNSAFSGWMQVSSTGSILNEGFISGEPDFGWAANGKLNWNAKSSFNPKMVPEMRLKLLINGIEDMTELEGMAERLNFPSNWKSLRTPEAPAETPVEAPTVTPASSSSDG